MDAANKTKVILFDGFSDEEILSLPGEQVEALVLNSEPQVFRIGSASVLVEFRRVERRLMIELAQIEGGGEGVLAALGSLAKRYARQHRLQSVEWIVDAVSCAQPNLKLRRVLDRRGFQIREIPEVGEAYHFVDSISEIDPSSSQ